DPGARIARGAVYKGQWGQYWLWIYNEWYVDSGTEGGTAEKEYPMLPDGTVVLGGPDMMATPALRQIIHQTVNYAALPYPPTTWVTEDPAQRYSMMQSSPIVIAARVNACMAANVWPTLIGAPMSP